MERPAGITAIASLIFICAGDLCVIGMLMLFSPDTVSMLGAPLLQGFEMAAPSMLLRAGAACALIGWGLFRMQNWARWVAMLGAVWGIAILVPSVSAAAMNLNWSLLWGGLQIIVRSAVVWYLLQAPVAGAFSRQDNAANV